MNCCDHPSIAIVEELGHTESVDWDLDQCASCGTYFLRQWSEYAADKVFRDKLTREEGEEFLKSEGRQRILLLKKWFNEH
jgi:hypothetical protein